MDTTFEEFHGSNSGQAQADATRSVPGENKAHLIGTDVLRTWDQKGYIEPILATASIIVSADPSDMETYEVQKAKFAGNPKIIFINVVTESIRSTDL